MPANARNIIISAASSRTHRRLAAAAVLATSLTALAAACANPGAGQAAPGAPNALAGHNAAQSASASPSATTGASTAAAIPVTHPANTLLVSNGTDKVLIGGTLVAFPTTVTDAVWSPSGARILFIDANQNVAVAAPDGTGLQELTVAETGVSRANPVWDGANVLFTETKNGASQIMQTGADGYSYSEGVDFDKLSRTESPDLDYAPDPSQADTFSSPSTAADPAAPSLGSQYAAFDQQSADGPEVWVCDLIGRGPDYHQLADGTDPAISPDGKQVAFVGTDGQLDLVAVDWSGTPTAVELTSGLSGVADPAWSADGSTLTFVSATGLDTVPAAGGPTTPVTLAQPMTGNLYADRLPGTAVQVTVADSTDPSGIFPVTGFGEPMFTLANPDDAADVMDSSAGYGRLLFTSGDTLDPAAAAVLTQALAGTPGGRITVNIVGGGSEISPAVEAAVRTLGAQTFRISTDLVSAQAQQLQVQLQYDRQNSVAPNASVQDNVEVVDEHDAAELTVLDQPFDGLVYYTDGTSLPTELKAYLAYLGPNAEITALDPAAAQALAGAAPGTVTDRFAGPTGSLSLTTATSRTAVVLADANDPQQVAEAYNAELMGGAVAMLFDPSTGLSADQRAYLTANAGAIAEIVLDGPAAQYGPALIHQLHLLIGQSAAWSVAAPLTEN